MDKLVGMLVILISGTDARQHFPRFSEENREANLRLVAKIKEIASAKGVAAAQHGSMPSPAR